MDYYIKDYKDIFFPPAQNTAYKSCFKLNNVEEVLIALYKNYVKFPRVKQLALGREKDETKRKFVSINTTQK